MKQICYICSDLYGIKEPIEDERETHGLCPKCFTVEMDKLRTKAEEIRKVGYLKNPKDN